MSNGEPATASEAARQRRREARVGNERAKSFASIATAIGNAIIIGGLIAPAFTDQLAYAPATLLLTFLAAGLLYGFAYLILSTLEIED